MAFGRKKKKESSSRYDRMKDGFSDKEEQLSQRAGVEIPDPGYGVRDSYSRQNAYWDTNEDSLFERRSGSYGDPAAGGKKLTSPESKEDWYRAGYNAGYRDRARGEKGLEDAYPKDSRRSGREDGAPDSSYMEGRPDAGYRKDGPDRTYAGRYPDDRYADEGPDSRFMEDGPEYDSRDEGMGYGPAAAAGGRSRRYEGRARKKKKGFWWKIILLVLAAAALFLV